MQRLRALSEEECYLRCYGARDEESVRVIRPGEASPEVTGVLTDRIRRAFEAGLEAREPEAA